MKPPTLRARCDFLWLFLLLLLLTSAAPARAEALIAYSKDGAIYTASAADGKGAKKICRGDDPCISNDGRFIAYTRNNSGKVSTRSIVVRDMASGQEATLPVAGAEQVFGALWSPDDQWIAFNALTAKSWQVAVSHPDGSGFHTLTDKLDAKGSGYYLAGWNLHDNAVLAQNLDTLAQLDPATSEVAWQRPVKEINGEESAASDLRCTISGDGRFVVSTRYVDSDEFKNLDGPSSYLVLTDFPSGTPRRVTPPKFDAHTPWLDPNGETVLLRGFGEKDITRVKGSDGVKLKMRIYRFDVRTSKLTPLIEGGESPSASRG
ncbi:MAG: hypothetical protein JO295_00480 [Verrucomicrobia bacterium]|nr:hypothetical protein [Verrucomicrobiota bacterium]